MAGLTLVAVGLGLEKSINVWGSSGFINRLLGFIQNLPGFYLAALAAVATFGDESMQRLMPGTPPTMDLPHNGGTMKATALSRRMFLSAMFSYLTALSILLTIGALGGLAVADAIKSMVAVATYPWLKFGATFIYLAFGLQLLSVTFWGLYYLGERLHMADS